MVWWNITTNFWKTFLVNNNSLSFNHFFYLHLGQPNLSLGMSPACVSMSLIDLLRCLQAAISAGKMQLSSAHRSINTWWGGPMRFFSTVMTTPVISSFIPGISGSNLTHWGGDKMAAILLATFWDAFSWMKMYELRLKFHCSLFLRDQLTIFQHWFG